MMGQMPMGNIDTTSDMALKQVLAAVQQRQLQARGMQQPNYQTNGVSPLAKAAGEKIYGDIMTRNNSMKGLI